MTVQDPPSRHPKEHVSPSRWNTSEFYLYYAAFIIVLPLMFKAAIDMSSADSAFYPKFKSHLSPGWFLGRDMDNSDEQYAGFRGNAAYIIIALVAHLTLSRMLNTTLRSSYSNLSFRIYFSLLFGSVAYFFLFGWNVLRMVAIMTANFMIAKVLGSHVSMPFITWIFNLAILFINDKYYNVAFGSLHGSLEYLDSHHGIYPRWDAHFNFTMLRMVSYNMDYYWSLRDGSTEQEPLLEETNDKDRVKKSRHPSDYNYINYMGYLFYLPLFMAGPIITFNDFISQLYIPSKNISLRHTIVYGIRLVATILVMEIMLHYIYVVAISKAMALQGMTAFEVSMVGYFNLKYIWLKLFIIWRFFRFWALADGIYTEENMVRCMSNNYSALGFWRSWHRSYNRWLIRYVYIPLGGTKYAMYNIWPVFTFVAVWHDISLKLLAWGWLISLFILPEIIATKLARPYRTWTHYRHLAAIGAVFNIIMMMVANLVGFAVGLDGVQEMIKEIFTLSGGLFVVTTFMCIFAAVHVMFEIRENEKRTGMLEANY